MGRELAAGDLDVELGLCMEDNGDLKDIFGPQCCDGIEADPGGLKEAKLQTLVYLVELYRLERENTFTHEAWGKKGQTSPLDYILGPKIVREHDISFTMVQH